MTVTILRADAACLPIPDASVDLIVTSPPYFGLRSYTDGGEHYDGQVGDEATPGEYLDALLRCTAEWVRVLKPGGSIFVNLGDKYAAAPQGPAVGSSSLNGRKPLRETRGPRRAYDVPRKSLLGLPWRYALRCVDELGLILRAEIIWSKTNAQPESVTDRVRRSHEQVFHLTTSRTYYAETLPQRSVWEIATVPLKVPDRLGVDHFAAYPPELVRRLVLGWSPAGGLVLDPFGGSGTTALVASVLGRVGVSADLSADYCRLARWRTTDPAERARVRGYAKPAGQVAGQLGFFEGISA